jgi:enterochelin esterase-like enzyme
MEGTSEFVPSGAEWSVPTVLDNLIHCANIPPTIAVFVTPGRNDDFNVANPTTNQRSVEYDTVSDHNAHFLQDEVLAPIEAEYNITTNPARRCACVRPSFTFDRDGPCDQSDSQY